MNDDAATERVEEIVCAALELEDSLQRAAFLKDACAGDSHLQSAVEAMIASQSGFEEVFSEFCPVLVPRAEITRPLSDTPGLHELVNSTVAMDEAVGRNIGTYKLVEKIGEGGCGVVYLAEQETPVRRKVALKIIKLGMDTRSVIARFEAERQALARMDHPNIAQVLDAGATETGRPYFVMELVRGTRITDFCDEHCFDTHRRLDLFIQVCNAIQHAHQKGIIHRDIKPSNVLVTMLDGAPLPKVIDFGIAKATDGERLTDKTLFTAYEQFVGTPAYMSPEQAQMSGLDADTRTDIYSLGVLLYELLTGKTPFDQKELLQSGLDEMRRTLREREPHRPSTKLDGLPRDELTQTAIHRQIEPLHLKSLLSGDLDWIVMKALEKDRNRRYETANELGVDVQRHLRNEPVAARPPSRFYRLQKLVRRNRATFIAIGAVTLTLIAGLTTSTCLFVKERQALREQSRLRGEAEARAKIAQAAVLISRRELGQADQLVDKLQIPVTEPSLEAAGVFRTLGDWNAVQGRWHQAADRFLKLVQANQVDKSDLTDGATRDLLRAGPTLVLAGDTLRYHQFVRETIARFADTQNSVAAEQVIKVSLIYPPDHADLRALEPMSVVVERSIIAVQPNEFGNNAYMLGWRVLALTLLEYRRGNFSNAIVWGKKCLEYSDKTPTRIAMAHVILAMSFSKIHQPDAARRELNSGKELIGAKYPTGFERMGDWGNSESGYWNDWVIAGILLREATTTIKLEH